MAERKQETVDGERPPYGAAIVAALGALALYVVTLAPTISFWDSSEYVATAHIMGIPHPAGNPLFVTFAKAWSLLLAPTGLPVATRVNLFAAATSAAATGFFFLVMDRVLRGHFADARLRLVGAACSAILGATAFTVWNQSNVNEKVYTVSVLIVAAVSWLALRWYDRREEPGSERLLLWAGFLVVLGVTNHMMSALPGPALLVFVLLVAPGVLVRPSFLMKAVPLVLLGLSFNFVLPIRSGLDPRINEGEPTCESVAGAAQAVFTLGAGGGCEALAAVLTREQYQTPPITQRKSPILDQLQMWLQYFEWQWARGIDPDPTPSPNRAPFTALFFGLGLAGLYAAWRTDRAVFAYLAVLTGTVTFALVVYLNFEYGYSLAPHIADPSLHEVRERDYFYVAGFMLWGGLAGAGLAWAWKTLAEALGPGRGWAMASPLLLVALVPMALNWPWASRAGDRAAQSWAYDLLMSVEPYAVLFTNGDNDTFPLWYMQEVEGVRQDVTVIVGQYLFTSWYIHQLQRHTAPGSQRPFDPDALPGLYEDRAPPARSIIGFAAGDLDRVTSTMLRESFTVPFPDFAVEYPAGMILDRSHQLALSIIHDSIDERPIYFSAAGGMLADLGLGQWGVRHGLAVKLDFDTAAEQPPSGLVRGSPEFGGYWFDVERSLRLYDDVYRYDGILDRPIWQDAASLNIPQQYYAMAVLLSDVVRRSGAAPGVADRLEADGRSFQRVVRGGTRIAPTGVGF